MLTDFTTFWGQVTAKFPTVADPAVVQIQMNPAAFRSLLADAFIAGCLHGASLEQQLMQAAQAAGNCCPPPTCKPTTKAADVVAFYDALYGRAQQN